VNHSDSADRVAGLPNHDKSYETCTACGSLAAAETLTVSKLKVGAPNFGESSTPVEPKVRLKRNSPELVSDHALVTSADQTACLIDAG
jgi:hypothetical protein